MLREIKTADQHCYKFLLTAKQIFLTQCQLIISNIEIIACKLEMFKNPIIYFINQEISAERERSIAMCQHYKQTKLRSMSIWNPVPK
jgi:hypothetical protein